MSNLYPVFPLHSSSLPPLLHHSLTLLVRHLLVNVAFHVWFFLGFYLHSLILLNRSLLGFCTQDSLLCQCCDLIDLMNYEAPIELTLNYFLHTENAPSGWDIASIEISEDGGEYAVVASNNNEGLSLMDQSGTWQSLSVDLSPMAGSTIQIRFHFNSVDNFSNNHPGFYVDDIVLTGAEKSLPPTARHPADRT